MAYHQQGKLEAAVLTLEEGHSILVYALGEKDEQVQVVKEKIKKLSVIDQAPANFESRTGPQPMAQDGGGAVVQDENQRLRAQLLALGASEEFLNAAGGGDMTWRQLLMAWDDEKG